MPTSVLTLFEATLALYPAGEDNVPALDTPIWIGACAERLKLADEFIQAETRPTARRYPKRHPLVKTHAINIDRVWVHELPDLINFVAAGNRYVLDIIWQDEDATASETRNTWKRRTYYGVTVRSDSQESSDLNSTAGHFMEDQSFEAEFFAESAGTGDPPPVSLDLPMQVQWVGHDGVLPLYDYVGGDFIAIGSGSALRAQLEYGSFNIFFTGVEEPALSIVSGTSTASTGFFEDAPTNAHLPRIEFIRGGVRLASLDSDGRFFAPTIRQAEPAVGAGKFLLYDDAGHTTLCMTIGQSGTTIGRIETKAVTPASITTNTAFGTPRVGGSVTPTHIGAGTQFGVPAVVVQVKPSGIASTASFGSPDAAIPVHPTGLASASGVGSPTVVTGWAVAGIPTGAAIGTPAANLLIYPAGLASSVRFGSTKSIVAALPSGVGSGAAFGTLKVIVRLDIMPAAIPSPTSIGAPSTLIFARPAAIPSGAALGHPQGIYNQDVTPTALASPATFGTLRVLIPLDPSMITGLKLWLKADAIGGLSDGDPVTTWSDSSGEGNDGSSSGGSRPIYHTSVVDGQPALHFDNQNIALPNNFTAFTAGELFIVLKLDAVPSAVDGSHAGIWIMGSSFEEDYIGYQNGGGADLYISAGSTLRRSLIGAADASYASWGLFNVASASNNYKLRHNGSQIYSSASNTVSWSAYGGTPYIGLGVSGSYLQGSVAEVILFNHVLSSDDRAGLQAYLTHKYPSLPL